MLKKDTFGIQSKIEISVCENKGPSQVQNVVFWFSSADSVHLKKEVCRGWNHFVIRFVESNAQQNSKIRGKTMHSVPALLLHLPTDILILGPNTYKVN